MCSPFITVPDVTLFQGTIWAPLRASTKVTHPQLLHIYDRKDPRVSCSWCNVSRSECTNVDGLIGDINHVARAHLLSMIPAVLNFIVKKPVVPAKNVQRHWINLYGGLELLLFFPNSLKILLYTCVAAQP